MTSILHKLFGGFAAQHAARGAAGHRAYVVGDIHGRFDLLEHLIARIEADIAARRPAQNHVVFLGDLIDRGPQSAQVVERLRTWRPADAHTVFLCGNHEEVLLRILDGEHRLLADWLKFGGAECLDSYGLPPARLRGLGPAAAIAAIREAVPDAHREFLASFADTFRFGDYLCVHAGIRPGTSLSRQKQSDLRWIRQPFLDDATDHGFVVVHGHTISEGVDERANRIGIDTGAYRSGVLSSVAIEGAERWFLDTSSNNRHP